MSRRLLQILIWLLAINALVGGGIYLVMGLRGISVTGVNISIDQVNPSWTSVDYLFRALAGVWFGLGIMLAWLAPAIEKQTVLFRFACLAMFLMGLGRLLSVLSLGTGSNPLVAMVLELICRPCYSFGRRKWGGLMVEEVNPD